MKNITSESCVIKIGESDYVKEITPNGISIATQKCDKLIFPNENIAKAYCGVIKEFVGNEKINVINYETDLKDTSFIGKSLQDMLDKAKDITLSKAKEMFENHKVLAVEKKYNVSGLTYIGVVRSQRSYETYETRIVLDKENHIISTSCECADYIENDNLNCKHVLATILAILN